MTRFRRFSAALSVAAVMSFGVGTVAPLPLHASGGSAAPRLTQFCSALSDTITQLKKHDGKLAQFLADASQRVYDRYCN